MTIRERVEAAQPEELPEIAAEIGHQRAELDAAEVALRLRVNKAEVRPEPSSTDRLLRVREAAEALSTSRWNVGEMVRKGILPHVRVGVGQRGVRIRESAVEKYKTDNERGAMISRGRRG